MVAKRCRVDLVLVHSFRQRQENGVIGEVDSGGPILQRPTGISLHGDNPLGPKVRAGLLSEHPSKLVVGKLKPFRFQGKLDTLQEMSAMRTPRIPATTFTLECSDLGINSDVGTVLSVVGCIS